MSVAADVLRMRTGLAPSVPTTIIGTAKTDATLQARPADSDDPAANKVQAFLQRTYDKAN